MVMAISLFWVDGSLFVVAGYENGLAIVARRGQDGNWATLYKHQAHSQPILSLGVEPGKEYFLTSGADAIIAKHPIPRQSTAGTSRSSGLDVVTAPLKILKTGHSGQQSLRIRSDGRIFATAGWDSKVRVYSAKTMAELAVLKWHDTGCYAAAFSLVGDDSRGNAATNLGDSTRKIASGGRADSTVDSNALQPKETALATIVGDLSVKERRIRRAKETHWLAAGSKDGKISLWDIY
jgi:ASTRA-associated protein 1